MKKLFGGQPTADAVKGQFGRTLKTHQMIVAFEKFTGNGGGDGDLADDFDSDNDTGIKYNACLKGARKAGYLVWNLSVKTIDQWYTTKWYDLFNNRCI